MKNAVSLCALPLLLAATALAQKPAFEVATIKPSAPLDPVAVRDGKAHIGMKIDATRVDIGTTSLLRLICMAYRVAPWQVKGPDWLNSTNFDILGKLPDGASSEQIPEMMQALLQDRFALKFHLDSKDQPVYALVAAKGGPRLKESPPVPDAPVPVPSSTLSSISVPTVQSIVKLVITPQGMSLEMPDGEISGKLRMTPVGGANGQPPLMRFEGSAFTMKAFAAILSTGVVDRPVVDMTGLNGAYDVSVDLSNVEALNVARSSVSFLGANRGGAGDAGKSPADAASEPSGASVYSSLEKLGLRLEARKAPLALLVIDHLEKTPQEN